MRRKESTQKKSFLMEQRLLRYGGMEQDALLKELDTNETGLTAERAAEVLEEAGENVIEYDKGRSLPAKLLFSIINPFSIVLLLIAAISFVTDVVIAKPGQKDFSTTLIIVGLVLISGVLQFVQEAKSDNAAQKLKAMVQNSSSVFRDGTAAELPITELVVGDVIQLSAGDILPADVRLLTVKDLFIGQAALTGESMPVEKFTTPAAGRVTVADAPNLCLMGSNVISGSATAVILTTGSDTYLGTLARSLSTVQPTSSFERGISDVSRVLLLIMGIMVPVIFIINGFTKHDWLSSLLFAVTVAVGLAPELLPMILTMTLAKGAIRMSHHKTIVKNLSAIQTFGAMDVLCTDKTGTLTEDHIILDRYLDVNGKENTRVLRHAFLNSYFQTGLKNLMDIAVITRADTEGISGITNNFTKVDEIPFDFTRRRMSVVLTNADDKRQLITKGAVEEILSICSLIDDGTSVHPLSDNERARVLDITRKMNASGLRVIALAQKNEVHDVSTFGVADEADMVLLGFVGFLDPPKPSSKEAIEALRDHGVRTIVLTGDSDLVAVNVCGQVGLDVSHSLLGTDVEVMDDEQLKEAVKSCNLFAKLSPTQKARVVEALQKDGHTVGYMGDGINDAPAMRQADVGISVDTAVDIAKETADIILLEKSLMVLEEGVISGRETFGNFTKYIKMAVSGNFGNMISVLVASIFLPILPMMPAQILTQNLLYDFSQTTIPLDRMDDSYIRKPRKWNARNLMTFVLCVGPISSIFDITTFLFLWFVFGYTSHSTGQNPANEALFRSGWFVEGLLSQVFVVHFIRTSRRPFIDSRAAWPLIASTALIAAVGIFIPYSPLAGALGFAPLPLSYFPFLLAVLICYMLLVQAVKTVYRKKLGSWL